MIRRVTFILACVCLPLTPSPASAEVWQVCTFETLPPIAMHYPNQGAATMSVDNRAPVAMTVGEGWDRIASATVNGIRFQFHPRTQTLSLRRDGETLATEEGRCGRIGGPTNETPFTWPDAVAVAEETPPPPETSAWDISTSTSRFDDSPTVVLITQATETVPARFGQGRTRPALVLRCLENTTVFYIAISDGHLADIQSYGHVDYRIDDQPPGIWRMDASTDNEALGLWNGGRAIPQIRRMIGADRLDIRLTPYSESPIEFGFDIRGLDEAITPLREACNW